MLQTISRALFQSPLKPSEQKTEKYYPFQSETIIPAPERVQYALVLEELTLTSFTHRPCFKYKLSMREILLRKQTYTKQKYLIEDQLLYKAKSDDHQDELVRTHDLTWGRPYRKAGLRVQNGYFANTFIVSGDTHEHVKLLESLGATLCSRDRTMWIITADILESLLKKGIYTPLAGEGKPYSFITLAD